MPNIDVYKCIGKKAYHIPFVDANMGLAQRPKAVAGLKPVWNPASQFLQEEGTGHFMLNHVDGLRSTQNLCGSFVSAW